MTPKEILKLIKAFDRKHKIKRQLARKEGGYGVITKKKYYQLLKEELEKHE